MKINFKSVVAGLALAFVSTPLFAAPLVNSEKSVKNTELTYQETSITTSDETTLGSCTISGKVSIKGVEFSITATAGTCAEARAMIQAMFQ